MESTLIRPAGRGPCSQPPGLADIADQTKLWQALEPALFGTGQRDPQSQKLIGLARSLHLAEIEVPDDGLDFETYKAIVHLQPVAELQGPHEQEVLGRISSRTALLSKRRVAGIIAVLRDLADLCRDEEWRLPLGNAGFVQIAADALAKLDLIGTERSNEIWLAIQTQGLRLIGNLCADTDANREAAVQSGGLQGVLNKFAICELVQLAVPAAFNICNDYDPAKRVAIEQGLFLNCLQVLESGPIRASRFGLLLNIIGEIVNVKLIPPNALTILLKAGLQGDLETEERAGLLNLINKLLSDDQAQKEIIKNDQVELVLGCLFRTYTETQDVLETIMTDAEPEMESINDSEEEEEESELVDEEQLTLPRMTLVHILADISAHIEFKEKYQVFTDTSMMVWKLRHIMPSPRVPIAQVACLMLGNLACTDDICIRMVKDVGIHQAASDILASTDDLQLLHATLGLLRNLALPVENKESLAMVGVIENLQKCWQRSINPQIQLAGASLVRQILNGSFANIQRAMLLSSPVDDGTGAMQTQLMALTQVWARTDELPIRTEIARTFVAVLRCLYSKDDDFPTKSMVLSDLFSNHTLGDMIIGMVLQSEYPVVRSEGWFALGLLARDEPGRNLIANQISKPDFLQILQVLIKSTDQFIRPEGSANGGMVGVHDVKTKQATKDRENAILLIHEFVKDQRSGLEGLQNILDNA